MPRRGGRSREETETRLLDAGAVVLARWLTGENPALALKVADVLAEANERLAKDDPGAPPFTTGAVGHLFGGKNGLAVAVLRHCLGPQEAGAGVGSAAEALLDSGIPPEEVLNELARVDHVNMTAESLPWTQTWLIALASAPADRTIARSTRHVYEDFDEMLVPVYREIAARQGRAPVAGVSWEDIAAGITALAEGMAIRALGDSALQDRALPLVQRLRAALWDAMTVSTPAADVVDGNPAKSPPSAPRVFSPASIPELTSIADELRSGESVLLKLTDVEEREVQRYVDFSLGIAAGLGADAHLLASDMLFLSPAALAP